MNDQYQHLYEKVKERILSQIADLLSDDIQILSDEELDKIVWWCINYTIENCDTIQKEWN